MTPTPNPFPGPKEAEVLEELSLRDQLLVDYDQLEDRIEDAATVELWMLGDWLARYVPNSGRGRPPGNSHPSAISLDDLADRRGRSVRWLSDLRKVAKVTEADRLPKIAPRVYVEALRNAKGDLMAANASLVTKGHRLRDQSPYAMESVDALKANLGKRTPEERADIVRELVAESTVRELLGDDPWVPGAEWADTLVLRIHTNVEALAELIAREGLRFAPSTPLAEMFGYLMEVEGHIGDVRAAVQERIRDVDQAQVS